VPGGEVASIYFQGNYMAPGREAAVNAYLLREIEAAGLRPAGNPRWVYLSAPEHTPDPENHYSEVVWPVTR
jgi:effector-binding domain-containing protein